MSVFSPVTWVPWIPWLGVGYVSWDALSTALKASNKLFVGSVYLVVYLITSFWQGQVTKVVSEPYLVMSLQSSLGILINIRSGRDFSYSPSTSLLLRRFPHLGSKAHHAAWTVRLLQCSPRTPLIADRYAFATLFGNLGGIRSCNVYTLRLFNTLVLIATVACASDCRALITKAWKRESKELSPSVLHTAFNIALFPPLFFFSALFYTDVLSTYVVLRMYRLFLQQKGSVWLYLAGILALTMRQTNIFWVAVYFGGLEVVRTIKSFEVVPFEESSEPKSWQQSAVIEFQRYSQGDIHDIPLKDAEIYGTLSLYIFVFMAYHRQTSRYVV